MSQTAVVQRSQADRAAPSSTALQSRPGSRTSVSVGASRDVSREKPPAATTTALTTTTAAAAAASTTTSPFRPTFSLTTQKGSTPPRQPDHSSPNGVPSSPPSTPGAWEHPRMDEVIRRQARSSFDGSNMRVIVLNAGLLGASVAVPMLVYHHLVPRSMALTVQPYDSYILTLLRAFFVLNILLATAPLFRTQDTCEDIPLTPAQRQLLALPPMSRPATPQERQQYTTPPRYSRSATPQSSPGSSLRAAHASASPLSGRGSPLDGNALRRSASGGSAQQQRIGGSPVPTGLQPAARRSSYSSSPLRPGDFDGANTPTKPSTKASVGLNSKWLYEKGRASPRLSGSAWGTGSVFT